MSSLKIESVKKVLFQVPPVENFYPDENIGSKSFSLDSDRSVDCHSESSSTQLIKPFSSDSIQYLEVNNPPRIPEITLSITPRLSKDSTAILSTRSLDSITLLNLSNHNSKSLTPPYVNNSNLAVPLVSITTESYCKPENLFKNTVTDINENPTIDICIPQTDIKPKDQKPIENYERVKDSISSVRSSQDDLKKSSNSNPTQKKTERRNSISLVALDKLKSLFSKKSSGNSRKDSIISLSDSVIRRESQISNMSRITDIYGGRLSRQNKLDNGNSETETWGTLCSKLSKKLFFCYSDNEEHNYYIENHTIARIVTVLSIIVIICIIISIIVKSVNSSS